MSESLLRLLDDLRARLAMLERLETPVVSGGGAGAPANATYLTLEAEAVLSAERRLVPAARLVGTDAGPNSTYTLDLATSGVAAGAYGSATQSGTFTVDAYGRLTAAANVAISGVAPSAHNLLSAFHGDTVANGATRGSLLYGNATPAWDELVLGGISGSVLTRDPTDALWSAFAFAGTAGQTYTFPAASGSVPTGTGTAGRVVEWAAGGATLEDSTLVKSGAGVLTLAAAGAYQLDANASGGVLVRAAGTPLTAGYVAFPSDGNTLTGDSGLFWDNVNKRLGVGTGSPGAKLHAQNDGSGTTEVIRVSNLNNTSAANSILFQNRSATVTARTSSMFVGGKEGAWNAADPTTITGFFSIWTRGNDSLTEKMRVLGSGNVGVNITTPTAQHQVHSNVATTVTQILRGFTAQSANHSEWQTVGGAVGLAVDSDFVLRATSQRAGAGVLEMLNLTALGGGANGDGGAVYLRGKSSTTAAQEMARISYLWNDATHATRKADLVLSAYDTAEREGLRLRGAGAAAALSFYGGTPVVRGAALTAQLTTITHTAPGVPDYAIQDFLDVSGGAGWAFASQDEANTVLSVIANLQVRLGELEARLNAATGVNLIA